jgi:hypothetical protein
MKIVPQMAYGGNLKTCIYPVLLAIDIQNQTEGCFWKDLTF